VVDATAGSSDIDEHEHEEVLANRAIEILGGRKGDYGIVSPLGPVNLSQVTNDV
jgi:aspartate ammonia-lyase